MHTKNLSPPPRPPQRYWQDSEWARQNIQSLIEKYSDEWIAVFGQQVVAHSNDLGQILAATKAQGLVNPLIKFIEGGIHVYTYRARIPDKRSLAIPTIKGVKFTGDPRLRREDIYDESGR